MPSTNCVPHCATKSIWETKRCYREEQERWAGLHIWTYYFKITKSLCVIYLQRKSAWHGVEEHDALHGTVNLPVLFFSNFFSLSHTHVQIFAWHPKSLCAYVRLQQNVGHRTLEQRPLWLWLQPNDSNVKSCRHCLKVPFCVALFKALRAFFVFRVSYLVILLCWALCGVLENFSRKCDRMRIFSSASRKQCVWSEVWELFAVEGGWKLGRRVFTYKWWQKWKTRAQRKQNTM